MFLALLTESLTHMLICLWHIDHCCILMFTQAKIVNDAFRIEREVLVTACQHKTPKPVRKSCSYCHVIGGEGEEVPV